ncbi:MAG: hypothetical protein ACWGHH_06765 [Sulfurovaceae bacterium]
MQIGILTKFKLDEKVILKDNDGITARIESIKVLLSEDKKSVTTHYLCGWFNNGSYNELWLSSQFLRKISNV